MSKPSVTRARVLRLAGCLLAVLTPWAGADEAPRPVPIVGTEAEFSGHLMGADCARWTTAGLTPDGYLLLDGDDGRRHTIISGGVRPEN